MKLKQTNSYKVSQSHHILNLATTGGRRIKRRLCTAPQSCYLCSTVCTYGVCIGIWIREHDPEYSSRSHVSSSICSLRYYTDTLPTQLTMCWCESVLDGIYVLCTSRTTNKTWFSILEYILFSNQFRQLNFHDFVAHFWSGQIVILSSPSACRTSGASKNPD